MAKTADDLEAVRTIANALEGFNPEDQERIVRWAREKIGLAPAPQVLSSPQLTPRDTLQIATQITGPTTESVVQGSTKDLKSFVNAKKPKSDVQFAAAVAYYYNFEAPPEQKKGEIDSDILQNACRLAGRERFKDPRKTLNNAKTLGMLDSGSEAGKFAINTVGENLVAMALPGGDTPPRNKKPKVKSKRQNKTANKK
jgi:hypothetical protein